MSNGDTIPTASRSLLDSAWFQYALAGALAAGMVFFCLGREALENHEARAALAARVMLGQDGGNWLDYGPTLDPLPSPDARPIPGLPVTNRWLVPVNNGQPRLVKTPLPYWVIAAVGAMSGGVTQENARVGSAVAAVLTVLVTLWLGRCLLGPRAGLLGALMLAGSVGMYRLGRNARPEMLLCLFITCAMAAFWLGLEARTRLRRTIWMLAFWVLMGFANLSKEFLPLLMGAGLVAFLGWRRHNEQTDDDGRSARKALAVFCIAALAMVLVHGLLAGQTVDDEQEATAIAKPAASALQTAMLALAACGPIALYMLTGRRWRALLPLLPTALPGAIVMFAMFLPWMRYMDHLFASANTVFRGQVLDRAAGAAYDPLSVAFYVWPLIMVTLPWVPLLPGALAAPWLRRFAERRKPLLFLFLWSMGLVVMLTLSSGKRFHYLLPSLPALCLLMGVVADDLVRNHRWLSERMGMLTVRAYGIVFALAPAVLAAIYLFMRDQWQLLTLAGAAVPAALAALAALLATKRRRLATGMVLLTVSAALAMMAQALCGVTLGSRQAAADFACRMGQATQGEPLAMYGMVNAQVTFYLGRNTPDERCVVSRLKEQFGQEQGQQRWLEHLRDPRQVPWLWMDVHVRPLTAADKSDTGAPATLERLLSLGYTIAMEKLIDHDRRLLLRNGGAAMPFSRPAGASGPTPPQP